VSVLGMLKILSNKDSGMQNMIITKPGKMKIKLQNVTPVHNRLFSYLGTNSLFQSESLLRLKNAWSLTCNTSLEDNLEYSSEMQSA